MRSLTTTHGIPWADYSVDVEPVPFSDNPSHAEIFGLPPFDAGNVFEFIQ